MTKEDIRRVKKAVKSIDKAVQSIQDTCGEKVNVITIIMSEDINDEFNRMNMIGTEFNIRRMLMVMLDELKTENQKINEESGQYTVGGQNVTIEHHLPPELPRVDKWVEVSQSKLDSPISHPRLPSEDEIKKYGLN